MLSAGVTLAMLVVFSGAARQERPPQTAQPAQVNPDAEIVADFQARVQRYLALRSKLEASVPPVPTQATAEEIRRHQLALERLIRQARPGARQGELLTGPVRAFIRRQVARVLAGPQGPQVRAALLDEEVRRVKLMINGRYPDDLPLTTVPSQILLSLPRLPPELEFRFVGDRLALLDGPARVVLDIMNNALP